MVTVEKVKEKINNETPQIGDLPEVQKSVEKKFYQKPIVWVGLGIGVIAIGLGIRAFRKNGSKIVDIQ